MDSVFEIAPPKLVSDHHARRHEQNERTIDHSHDGSSQPLIVADGSVTEASAAVGAMEFVSADLNPESIAPSRPSTRRRVDPTRRIAAELERRIGDNRFRMWFSQARVRMRDDHLEVVAESAFVAKWIDTHFSTTLGSIAADALGREVPVEISVAPEAAAAGGVEKHNGSGDSTTPSARGREHDASARRGGDRSIDEANPAPTRGTRLHNLADFVVGGSNRLAYTAACRLADGDDLHGLSPLFIHGECGVGKTHLLQGVCRRFIERYGSSSRVRYVTGEQFTNEFIAALRTNSIDSFRSRVRRLALLAIDDVHFLANKIKTQSEFQCTLDAIDFGGARVVLASDNHPHHIRRFSQSLVSRFVSGMVVRVEKPDRELRTMLIRHVAQRRGLRLSHAAVDELASQGGASVRELEGAMTRLAAWRSMMDVAAPSCAPDSEIGLLLVQQVLRDDRVRPGHIVRIASVIEAVCERLGISRADLVGSSRHRRVVIGRSLVAYLARELTTLSFPEIAQSIGRENHSTVHTADQRLRGQLQRDDRLRLGGNEPATSLRELADLLRRDLCKAPA